MAALSSDEKALVSRLLAKLHDSREQCQRMDAYYEGKQRLEHMGLATPPELRRFETVINMPRMAVDEPERRQALKGFQRIGTSKIDAGLQDGWDYNNMSSQSSLAHKDARTYGRAYVTVGANPEDPGQPLITVEPPDSMETLADGRGRRVVAALRTYDDETDRRSRATLYLPDATRWLVWERSGWVDEQAPNEHRLGRVPVVVLINRPRTGRVDGVSEMADVIGMTDAIARMVTNMQVAGEALAVPHRWATGLKPEDFVDKQGRPRTTWEAYMDVMKLSRNPDAKFGSFAAADLKNFTDAVNNMMAWCAAMLGLPTRYAGQQSVNPATEGAIRADEARLIKNVERMNTHDGDAWAWVMGLRERLISGEWPATNDIRALWFDPATPTRAQMADATMKMFQVGVLSREGAWDEMGWDTARKDLERAYFAAEAADPLLDKLADGAQESGGGRTS